MPIFAILKFFSCIFIFSYVKKKNNLILYFPKGKMQENLIGRIWGMESRRERQTEFALAEERAVTAQPFLGKKAKAM